MTNITSPVVHGSGRVGLYERSILHLEITLQVVDSDSMSIHHERNGGGNYKLSISGHTLYVGGQCIDALEQCDLYKRWTEAERTELVNIWRRWHLNHMRAGCAHQEVVYEDSPYGRCPSLTLTPPCPESGYRYGSAWLFEPLPTDVVDRVLYFADKLAS